MGLDRRLNSLCSPAYLYLAISVILLVLLGLQNLWNGNNNQLCVGAYKCNVSNVLLIFGLKIIYIAFWTVVLDSLCKYGLKELSWFLVLFPIVLAGVLLGLLLVEGGF